MRERANFEIREDDNLYPVMDFGEYNKISELVEVKWLNKLVTSLPEIVIAIVIIILILLSLISIYKPVKNLNHKDNIP